MKELSISEAELLQALDHATPSVPAAELLQALDDAAKPIDFEALIAKSDNRERRSLVQSSGYEEIT